MARKKVVYKVTITKHGVFPGETEEDVKKEVQKQVDFQFYANSDTCETEILKVDDLD